MIEIKGGKIFLAAKKNAEVASDSGVSERKFRTQPSNVEELAL
jgi:hypothetical protein